jgi:hypothetical protein
VEKNGDRGVPERRGESPSAHQCSPDPAQRLIDVGKEGQPEPAEHGVEVLFGKIELLGASTNSTFRSPCSTARNRAIAGMAGEMSVGTTRPSAPTLRAAVRAG